MRKSYGRIFVQKEEDIQVVLDVVAEFFAHEVNYLGKDVIAVWKEYKVSQTDGKVYKYVPLVFTHKFEPDLETLIAECMARGVWITAFTGHRDALFEIKPRDSGGEPKWEGPMPGDQWKNV